MPDLFPFQQRVADYLLGGRNVILQAPTGAGKTRAAITPFIHAWRYGQHEAIPPKCIYSVPMRVLATQFHHEYKAAFDSFSRRWGWDGRREPQVKIQTGENSKDPSFAGDLIFATIDQTLSSFLLMPYSLPRRQANLNAGAVAGAYLVFDEFHLFDPESTLPTTLDMLDRLRGLTPMLLMTATFSKAMLGELAGWLDAQVVSVPPEELLAIPSQRDKRRLYHASKTPLSADVVLSHHQRRSLAVCNTVDRARKLYHDLQTHPGRGETRVILLHSRFLPDDRRAHEDDVRQLFGKDDRGEGSVIAVATQVIEVGLDITCESLHTELAPANAILQRAGRCARFPGQAGQTVEGHVAVYPVENYQPYKDDGLQEECERTWTALQARDGETLNFAGEQALIDEVHTERDRSILEGIRLRRSAHRRDLNLVLNGQARGAQLVRNVSARAVTVHAAPDALLAAPWATPSFSLHPGSVYGLFKDWQERAQALGLPWAVKRLEESSDDKTQGGREVRYQWADVTRRDELTGAVLVVVNNRLAGYRADEGFLPDEDTSLCLEPPPSPEGERRNWQTVYRLEPYAEHIRQVCQALRDVAWEELDCPAATLEKREGWPRESVTRAAWAVAALHDTGKLTSGWQSWARDWQQRIGHPMKAGQAAAHTDYNSGDPAHRQIEQDLGRRRPSHALEGAVAAAPILAALLGDCPPVLRAAFTAIARHHGPFTREYHSFQLDKTATGQMDAVRALLPTELAAKIDPTQLIHQATPQTSSVDEFLVTPDEVAEFVCYTLLIRALRRADQAGTQRGTEIGS